MEWITSICTMIVALVSAFYSYNQYTKNKMTDLKLDTWKAEEEKNNTVRSSNIAKIYRELWELLHQTGCDRVYIVQPHPLVNSMFVSISFEVNRRGVGTAKELVENIKIKDVARFVGDMAQQEFMIIQRSTEVEDKRAKALMQMLGVRRAAIRRLSPDDGSTWIGSIFVEYTRGVELDHNLLRKEMDECAENIQYILPEYK